MKYLIAILLILFATFVDIFLYRISIVPVEPSHFLIPLFFIVCAFKYPIEDLFDIFKSHTFKLFTIILILSVIYSAVSSAPPKLIISEIVLNIFSLLIYAFTVHFFRTEKKSIVFITVLLSFIILSLSVWYDYFFGLPKFTKAAEEMLRKGGFGENPNQAASAMKFLALCVLFFLQNNKGKKTLFIIAMVVSIFMTFSRSGIISVILILVLGTANGWSSKFHLNPTILFKSFFRMIILFSMLYLGLLLFAGVIKSQFPELGRGAMGERIDLLLGKSDVNIIEEDLSSGGRGDLLIEYTNKFKINPFGHGTAHTSDRRYSTHETHNYYLHLAVNLGLIALLTYLIYLTFSIKLSLQANQFYYLIFIILIIFEGFVTHNLFFNRSILICLAFFDSLVYKKEHYRAIY